MNKVRKTLLNPFRDFLVLDLRALGLFRIFFGIILIIDFLDRLKDVEIFYSSAGITYPSLFSGNIFSNNTFSLNFLSGDANFQAAILIIGLIVSILFTLGYFTKISTIILWILVVSIQNLNSLILQGGDDYIRLLLFWSIFLPLGRRFAIDTLHNTFSKENRYFSVANIGLLFQVAFLYFFTAELKNSPIWTTDYTAVYYALNLDVFTTPIGEIVLSIPWLPPIMTFFAINAERIIPFLILLPFYNQFTRIIAVLLIIGLHFGIGLTMDVGPFTWICMAVAISLIHTQWLDLVIGFTKSKIPDSLKSKIKSFRKEFTSVLFRIPYPLVSLKQRTSTNKFYKTLDIVITCVIVFTLLSFMFVINLNSVGYKYDLGEIPNRIVRLLRIDQNWKMFAPYPTFEDGWTVVVGYDEKGETYDLYQGNSRYTKPDPLYSNPKNERWRKYTMNLWGGDRYKTERIYFLGYYCRQSLNGKIEGVPSLNKLEFYHIVETTQPNYEEPILSSRMLTTIECSR